jgi:hypothetical protein
MQALASAARTAPPGAWVTALGFDDAKYEAALTRWDLDRAASDRPIGVYHVSGHHVVVNSLALAERGLDESTPNPPGGRLVRDDGRLNGWCLDAAMNLILPVAVDVGSHGPNFHGHDAGRVGRICRPRGSCLPRCRAHHGLRRTGDEPRARGLPGGRPSRHARRAHGLHAAVASARPSGRWGSPALSGTIASGSAR